MEPVLSKSDPALLITNRKDFITKWDRYYKLGQFYCKMGQVLQGGTIITEWALTSVKVASRQPAES